MKKLVINLAIVLCSLIAHTENGTIKGTITETIGEIIAPIPFANIIIEGTSIGTTTDFDGKFNLSIPEGNYNLIVSFIGYTADTTNIEATAGEVFEITKTLTSSAQQFGEFVIEAKQNRESESLLLMEQKNASKIQQSIGAQEMAAKGVSDVAEGLTKVSGITKSSSGSKSIFVRGMGDRYNNALVNGLPVPSPNPDLKVIPFDIFPTDIVQNLEINKTFTPNLYGDFAGGTINISTKDYPEQKMLQISAGTTINTSTTFKNFKKSDMNVLEGLGYGTGDRNLPSKIQNEKIYNSNDDNSASLNNNFNNSSNIALPGYSLGLTGGNYKKLKKENAFGYLVSGSHSSGYQTLQGNQKLIDNEGTIKEDYFYEKFNYSTSTSVLGNLFYKINDNHSLNFNTMYIHTSANEVSEYNAQMLDFDRDAYLLNTRNSLRANTLFNNQLRGKHTFLENEKLEINWGLSSSIANSNEPDRAQLLYQSDDLTNYSFSGLNASDNHRFYSDLKDSETAYNINGKLFIKKEENKSRGNIEAGVQGKSSQRVFWWRQMNIKMDQLINDMNENDLIVSLENPNEYLNDDQQGNGAFYYKEQIDPSREHEIWQSINSFYANLDYNLIEDKLNVNVGGRVEQSSQTIKYKKLGDLISGPSRLINYDTTIVLPGLSLKYSLNKKSNLRFAASKTVSRPGMKELSPFQFQDQAKILYEGNPNLTIGTNYNADLKYEVFPNNGEVMAFSVFGKYLKDPIERAEIPSSGTLFSYFNVGEAYVAGVEIEISKTLGNILNKTDNQNLNNTTIGFNVSYLYSKLSLGDENTIETSKGSIIATNLERPMTGASPLLINADIGYKLDIKSIESKIKLTYNHNGKKVFAAGAVGKGDIYELAVNTVDFVMKNKINEKLSVDIKLKNLLNPSIQREQEANGQTVLLNDFKKGRIIGLSLKYKIL
jgi:hypothetical protein